MSSVNSTYDGGYNYQVRRLEELEGDLQSQAKRKAEKDDERLADIEGKYKADLQKKSAEMEKNVDQVKRNTSDQVQREREYAKAEVDKIKATTYDKYGRFGGEESDVIRQQMSDAKAAWDVRHQQDKRQLTDQDEAYQRKISDMNTRQNEELLRVSKAAHDSATEAFTKSFGDQRSAYAEHTEEAKAEHNRIMRDMMDEQNYQRRLASQQLTDAEADFEHRVSHLSESNDDRAEQMARVYSKKAENETRRLNDSHAAEGKQLRDKIKDLVEAQNDYAKGAAEGRHDAVHEYENEHRARERRVMQSYDDQIGKLKQDNEQTESYLSEQSQRTQKEKDAYFAKLIRNANDDARAREKDLKDTFNKDREQMTLAQRRDREIAQKTLESQLGDANKQRSIALENQAKAYQETMERNRQSNDDKIRILEKSLHESKTSTDSNVISPAAEDTIRKAVVREYEKQFAQDNERNRGTIDSIQREYSTRLQDETETNRSKTANMSQQNAAERHSERQELLSHIQDVEFLKDSTLRSQSLDHDKTLESLNRQYSQMLERQRKQYDEILLAQRSDAINKQQLLRQEAEFAARMNNRAFSAKQTELIREYERKLADQKAEFDAVTQEMRVNADRTIRENDRRHRADMEQQAQSYEQRIAQLEYTHKERERYIESSYKEDLDKARRSNAEQSTRKKS